MRIIVDYEDTETKVLTIEKAEYLGNHSIKIRFNNGVEKLVKFKPFLMKSLHPSTRKYLDEDHFIKFEIVNGNLNWNDYDLIFPVVDLYEGKIDR